MASSHDNNVTGNHSNAGQQPLLVADVSPEMMSRGDRPAPALKPQASARDMAVDGSGLLNKQYTPVRLPAGKVVGVWGKAFRRGPNGELIPLAVGETVAKGDVIFTQQDGIVQIEGARTNLPRLAGVPTDTDTTISALERGAPQAVPGAGPQPGGLADELGPQIRVDRIVETLSPLALPASLVAAQTFGVVNNNTDALPADAAPAAPEAVQDVAVTREDTAIAVPVIANDPSGAPLHVTAVNGVQLVQANGSLAQVPVTANGQPVSAANPAVGTVQLAPNGELQFTPVAGYNGPAAFNYVASNEAGQEVTAPVNITVLPVNDTPAATDDAYTTAPGQPVSIPIASNDTDPDNDRLTPTVINGLPIALGGQVVIVDPVTGKAQGTVKLSPTGDLSFEPAPGFVGTVSFPYTVGDPTGATASATATIVVAQQDTKPLAGDDLATTPIDTPVTVSVGANDSTPDGAKPTVATLAGQPAVVGAPVTIPQGTVTLNPDGTVTFVPKPGFTGSFNVPYTVVDAAGNTAPASIVISVGANEAPSAESFTRTLGEDAPYILSPTDLGFADPDSHTLAAVRIDTLPNAGQLLLDGKPLLAGQVVAVADIANGRLQFVPGLNESGTNYANFNFSVQDSYGAFATAPSSVTFNIEPVADGPQAAPDVFDTPEDTPVALPVLGNDTQPDGGALTVTQVAGQPISPTQPVTIVDPLTGVPQGTVTMAPDGSLSFTPVPGFNGTVNIPYQVTDETGKLASSVATVNIAGTEDPPVANDDLASTTAGTPVSVNLLGNDSDPDGVAPTVGTVNGQAVTPGATTTITLPQGTLVVDPAGQVTFTPNPGFSGPVSVPYTVTDAAGNTDSATLTINVGANAAPTGTDKTTSTPEDTPYTVTLADILGGYGDADGDALSNVRIDTVPASGTLVLNGVPVTPGQVVTRADIDAGKLSFVPRPNESGTPYGDFTFSVQDSRGAFDEVPNRFVVNVTPVNDAPTARADFNSTTEETLLTVSAANGVIASGTFPGGRDSDVEGNPLTVVGVSTNGAQQPTGNVGTGVVGSFGVLTLNSDGSYTYLPDAATRDLLEGETRQDVFKYSVSDGQGGTTATTLTITIIGTSGEPVAAADVSTTPEDTPITIPVLANDVDRNGDPLTINSVNGQPISEGSPVTITDPADPAKVLGTVELTPAGELVFTPAPGVSGPVQFPYTVQDPLGNVAQSTVTVNVLPVNDPPTANPDSFTTPEGTALPIALTANDSDPDGDKLTPTSINGLPIALGESVLIKDPVSGQPQGTVTLSPSGELTFTPAPGFSGPVTFPYTVGDPTGATSSSTVTINVTAVPQPPVANDDLASTPIGTPVTVPLLANDSDPDGTPPVLQTIAGQPVVPGTPIVLPQGTLLPNPDGTVTFTPAPGFTGPVNIPYTVTDPQGNTDTATLTVNVGANTPPTGQDAVRTIVEDGSYTVLASDLGFADADGHQLAAVRIDTLPGNGQLLLGGVPVTAGQVINRADIVAGKLSFVPDLNENGDNYANFTFSVQDSLGAFDTAPNRLTINVTPVEEPPLAKDDQFTVAEDTPLPLTLLANDSDPDGQPLKVTEIAGQPIAPGGSVTIKDPVTGLPQGTVSMAPDGSLTFTPAPDFSGPVSFPYTIADPQGNTDTAQATVNVTPVDEPPVAKDDLATTPLGTPVTVPLLANDSDPDGDPVTVATIAGQPATPGSTITLPEGTVTIDPQGNLTFTPDPAFAGGPVNIPYTITDPQGNTAPAVLTVNVGENTPPTGQDGVKATPEDTPYVLKGTDFGFNDADLPDTFAGVRIDTLPANGLLALNGKPLAVGDVVPVADIAAGQLAFVPNPNENGAPYASFTFSVQDSRGAFDLAPNTLVINVTPVNDAPTAQADVNATTEGVTLTVSAADGVINSASLPGGRDSDIDGDTLTVSAVGFNGVPGSVGAPIVGANGTLTLKADGSYSYTPNAATAALNAGESVKDVFTYSVSDGKGGTAQTTLTITVAGASNGGPVVTVPDDNGAQGGDNTIVEGGAPITGSFSISAPDGLSSVEVGGVLLTPAQLAALGTSPVAINTGEGTLTLTGFDPATGQVTYTYSAPPQTNPADVLDSIPVVVTDTAGNSATDTLDILITDTAPVARADLNSIVEDAVLPATGNVISTGAGADTLAADPAQVATVRFGATAGTVGSPLAGAHGTLTLNPDGSYSYALNNADPAVQALNSGDSLTEVFTYVLRDADGDESTTTLTITINGATDGPPVIKVPDDNGAQAGDNSIVEGGAPISGSFTISAPDGLGSLSVGGTVLTPAQLASLGAAPVAINTGEGTLTLTGFDPATGTVSYTYSAPAQTNPADVLDSIPVVVTDTAGRSVSDSLDILITDTAPVAVADVNSIVEDTAAPATGNVISTGAGTDTLGADLAQVATVNFGANPGTVGAPLAGAHGSLTLNPDGSYSYTLNNADPAVQALNAGESLTEVFTYVLRDADGDESTTTLTITINGATDGPPVIKVPDDNGAQAGDNSIVEGGAPVSGSFTVSAPDGLGSLTVGGTVLTPAQLANLGTTPAVINTGEGTLTLTGFDPASGTVSYTYTAPAQTSLIDVLDSIPVVVTDRAGNSATDSLDILITDTAPVAVADVNSIVEDTAAPATGNVISTGAGTDTLGADLAQVATVNFGANPGTVGAPLAGAHGSLTLNPDGSYSYTLNNADPAVQALNAGESLTEVFTYVLRDADGDESTTTLTITINGATDGPPVIKVPDDNGAQAGDNTIVEGGAPVSGSFTVSAPDGLGSLTVGGTVLTPAQLANLGTTPAVINTGEGTLTLTGFDPATGTVSYTYSAPAQTNPADVLDSIPVVVTDRAGNSATDSLDILITDTAPVARADVNSIVEDTVAPATGNVISTGAGADTLGADLAQVATVNFGANPGTVGSPLAGAHGSLTLNPDGSYSYTLNNADPAVQALNAGESLTEVFTYVLRDADGDESTTTLNITISGATDGPPVIKVPDDNGAQAGDNTIVEGGTPLNGSFTVTTPDGLGSLSVGGTVLTPAQLANLGALPVAINTGEGTLTLTGFDPATGTVRYTYSAPAQTNPADVLDSIPVVVTDRAGNSATDSLDILITDTAPAARPDVNSIGEDAVAPATGNVITTGAGADTLAADPAQVAGVSFNGAPGTVGAPIAGAHGALTLNPDGSYSYALNTADPAVQALRDAQSLTEVFTYVLRDADGDESTTTLTITINGSNDAPVVVPDVGRTPEDQPLNGNVLANDTDVDGPSLAVTAINVPGLGSFAPGATITFPTEGTLVIRADGSFTFNPAPNYNGPVPVVTYTVSDGTSPRDATLTLTVDPVNDAPAGTNNTLPGTEDTPVTIRPADFGFTDPDVGDTLAAVRIDTLPVATDGRLTLNGVPVTAGQVISRADLDAGLLRFEPALNRAGESIGAFNFSVQDSGSPALFDPAPNRINFTLAPVNDPPVANDDIASTPINQAVTINVKANDTDPDNTPAELAVSSPVVDPALGTAVVNPDGTITFTPAANITGPVTITYTLTDPEGRSDIAVITVNVGTNNPPLGTDAARTIDEDTPYTLVASDFGFTDVDLGQTLASVRIDAVATNGRLQINGVNVVAGQVIPVASINAGLLRFVPDLNENGNNYATFRFSVQDSAGSFDTLPNTFLFNVNPVNDAPVARADTGVTTEDLVLNVSAANGVITSTAVAAGRDTDVDLDSLSVSAVSFGANPGTVGSVLAGANGSLILSADGSYRYVPAASTNSLDDGESVQDVFTYTVSDGNGGIATSTLTITVTGTNDAPQLTADTKVTAEDTAVSDNVLANDTDADVEALTVTGFTIAGVAGSFTPGQNASIPGVGTLVIQPNGDYTFTPALNFNGPAPLVTYTATDGTTPVSSTLTINVTPVNDPPVANDDSATTPINRPVTIDVKANDSDPDNSPAQLTVSNPVVNPAQGTAVVNPDGTITFTPANNVTGPVTITYTLTDPDGRTDTATITVNVGANTPPTGTDVTRTIAEDGSYTVQPSDFGFADADVGQTLAAVRIDTLPGNGTLTLNGVAVTAGQVIPVAAIAAGQLRMAPDANENGNNYASFGFSVQDNAGAFDTAPNTFTLNVTPVNDDPVALADLGSTSEQTPLTVTAANGVIASAAVPAGRDSDVDGDTLNVSAVSFGANAGTVGLPLAGANGTLVLNANGSYTYTPAASTDTLDSGESVVDVFNYTVSDGNGGLANTTLTITVTGTNDAPTVVADVGAAPEDTPIPGNVLANDSDVDGEPLSVASFSITGVPGSFAAGTTATIPGVGTLLIQANGDYLFTPVANFNGPVPVATYLATDGTASVPGTLTLNVTPVNDAPTGADKTITTAEDTPVTLSAADFGFADVDVGDALSAVRIDNLPATGSLTLNGSPVAAGTVVTVADINAGLLRYTAPLNANGVPLAGFDFSVRDSGTPANLFDLAPNRISFNVTPVNDAPSGADKLLNGTEDTPLTITAADFGFTDPDVGDTLAAVRIDVPPATGSLSFNGSPVLAGTVITVADINAGLLRYIPALNTNGAVASFDFSVRDSGSPALFDVAPNRISINLAAVNDPPVANDDVAFTPINQAVTVNVKANDTDPDNTPAQLTVSNPVVNPALGTAVVNPDGTISFTPANNVTGPVTITYTLTDPSGASDTATITVNVGGNTPPTGADVTRTIAEDGSYTVLASDLGFADADAGQTLAAVRIDSLPGNGTLQLNGVNVVLGQTISVAAINAGQLRIAPDADENGNNYSNFTFSVQDNAGAFDTAPNTFTLNVTPVNDAPSGADRTVSTAEDTPYTVSAADFGFTDPDLGDTLALVRIDSLPVSGTLQLNGANVVVGQSVTVADINAGLLRYLPPANNFGAPLASFTFSVRDSGTPALFDVAPNTLNITVTPVNDNPVANPDQGSTTENAVLTVTQANGVIASGTAPAGVDTDLDGDSLSVSAISFGATVGAVGTPLAGANGSLTLNADGSYTYTPNAAANALDTGESVQDVFTYTVSDGKGGTAQTSLTITVNGSNDAPTVVADSNRGAEDNPLTGNVLTNDSDPDVEPLTVASFTITGVPGSFTAGSTATIPGVGSLIINANGSYSFTPVANFNGSVPQVTYVATDGTSNASTTLSLVIDPVNDAPAGTNKTISTSEDTPVTITAVDFGFSDPDVGDTMAAVRIDTLPATGSLTLNGVAVTPGQVISRADIDAGRLSYLPGLNLNGESLVGFNFSVQDSGSPALFDPVPNRLTVSVTPLNDPPVANDDNASTPINQAVTVNVKANDSDPDNTPAELTVSNPVVNPAQGTAVVNPDGTITFTPAANFTGAATITYTLTDLEGRSDTAVITVTVGANTPPTGADTARTILEDGSYTLLSGDFGFADADAGQTLAAVRIDTLPGNGTLTLNGVAVTAGQVIPVAAIAAGQLRMAPDANENGNNYASFGFSVQDNAGAFDTAPNTFTLNVTPVNDPPTGADKTLTTVEDTPLSVTAADFGFADLDPGDTLTAVRIDVLPATGSLQLNGAPVTAGTVVTVADINAGLLRYVPATNANGAPLASFDFSVRDSSLLFDTAPNRITVNVTPVNDAPSGADKTLSGTEDTPLTITAADFGFTDPDVGDTLAAVRIDVLPATGTLALNGTPVTAGTVITVADINAGLLRYTPALNANGTVASFDFSVRDSGSPALFDVAPNRISINLAAVNDPPVANDDSATTPINQPVTVNVKANDTDPDNTPAQLTVSNPVVNPALGTAVVNPDGTITFTPAANVTGPVVITYTLTDPNGQFDTATLTVNVGANTPPTGADVTRTIAEDGNYTVLASDLGFADADAGQTLAAVRIDSLPAKGTLQLNGVNVVLGQTISVAAINAGQLRIAPAANENGNAYSNFSFSVQDNAGAFDAAPNTFTLNVTPVNDAPSGADKTVSTAEDTPYTVSAADFGFTDPDLGDTLALVRIDSLPVSGTLQLNGANVVVGQSVTVADINAGLLRYLPPANNFGAPLASFTFSVRDSGTPALFDVAPNTLNITVTPVNDNPVANPDQGSTTENAVLTVTQANGVIASGTAPAGVDTDVDGDSLSVSAISFGATAGTVGSSLAGAWGSLVLNANGSYTYTPNAAANALDTGESVQDVFTYTVSDGKGGTAQTSLTITVNGSNDAPTVVADSNRGAEDNPLTGNVLTNDSDPDVEPLTVASFTITGVPGSFTAGSTATIPGVGSLVINANGSYTFTPTANFNGTVPQVTYVATDGTSNASTTLSLVIDPVNDAPAGTSKTITSAEDTPYTITAADFGFSDPDVGDTMTAVRIDTLPASGSLTLNGVAVTAGTVVTIADINAGLLRYLPGANLNGESLVNFDFSVRDSGSPLLFDPVPNKLTFSITPVNDAPTANNDTAVATEDTALVLAPATLLLNDTDPDADPLTITSVQGAVNGTVALVGGNVVFTPATHYSGPASFTYTVRDVDGLTSTATVNLTVNAVADQPSLTVGSRAALLVVQNSWESVTSTSTTSEQVAATPFEGWTRVDTPDPNPGGTNALEFWTSGDTQQRQDLGNNIVVASAGNGEDFLELNNAASNVQTIGIQRSIATQAGMVYELSFDYAGRPGFGTTFTNVGIYVDGVLQQSYAGTSPQTFIDWQNIKFHFAGDGAAHVIQIRTDATAFDANGRGAFVDDVVISATQGVVAGNGVLGAPTTIGLASYITAALVDGDGSESLSLAFAGLPTGATVTTAANPGGYAIAGGVITIPGAELASAQLNLPGSFTGHLSMGVTARATEGSNGSTATASATLELDVAPELSTVTNLPGDGLTNVIGTNTAETLTGGAAAEQLIGRDGNDVINANGGADTLDGGSGNDTLNGAAGTDALWGGAGNDNMSGGTESDTFFWNLADRGAAGTPALDTISDFTVATPAAGGDVLNLKDLLIGEHTTGGVGNLQAYLDFDTTTTAGTTIIRISSTGGFTGGTYNAAAEDQRITLTGTDLRAGLGLAGTATDNQVLQELLNRGKLVTDN
ncbi:VCBS repeat-containing protein [Burkholderiales bacterium JOSHI_001]|nr:VCBS repeat-containing protein [Burkholderiales bacterium JOSHI_001]